MKKIIWYAITGGWLGGAFTAFSGYYVYNWQWWAFIVPTITLFVIAGTI